MRQTMMRAVFALCLGLLGPATLHAQDFPNRPVKLIVGFPPGAMADTIGRTLSEKLPAIWNQPVVVENRPGATGTIAADLVAKAAPDGHTLLVILTNHVILPAMRALPLKVCSVRRSCRAQPASSGTRRHARTWLPACG